ncbi:MAG: hypothetical protein QM234_02815 [Acidobacteriota bacterium]|nr:hypothetical protein [Acidobacteriota bacterium]
MVLFGVIGLVGAGEVAGGLFGMGLGLLFLAFAYYYSRYYIVVKPDSITVNQPFRGQWVITHKNIVSVKEWDYRQKWYKVKFRDGDKIRKVSLSPDFFVLTPFFSPTMLKLKVRQTYGTPDDKRDHLKASVRDLPVATIEELKSYVDVLARSRDRYSVCEGLREEALILDRAQGRFHVFQYVRGKVFGERWFNDEGEAVTYYRSKVDSFEGVNTA